MKQDFYKSLEMIKIRSVDLPIMADLFDKTTAERCLSEILKGNTNLVVLYDDDNPPVNVREIEITYKIK